MHIACLHTAESNIAVFEAALAEIGAARGRGARLRHAVHPALLAEAEAAGGLTPEIAARTATLLRQMAAEGEAVLLTCSTLGPAAEGTGALRADAALARRAVAEGGQVSVLCAVATTLAPTRALFTAAAAATGAEVTVILVPGAWDAFRAGDREGYLDRVARAAEAAPGRVALAQASMAGAAGRVRGVRPLTSPEVALESVLGF
ncbi:hypothetical protein NON00_22570 [Roseomonas sp. GC11]|uniref:hypothetical protein n=1 Tax=Roseomonas sp. GC11 TaxID=2950546 RepID=UPI00210B874C|nr:hypothetical protein [Roseomonas sp. GC11]MCQ4162696.1 hypothetical protein [Roseomonas sp. GC11]